MNNNLKKIPLKKSNESQIILNKKTSKPLEKTENISIERGDNFYQSNHSNINFEPNININIQITEKKKETSSDSSIFSSEEIIEEKKNIDDNTKNDKPKLTNKSNSLKITKGKSFENAKKLEIVQQPPRRSSLFNVFKTKFKNESIVVNSTNRSQKSQNILIDKTSKERLKKEIEQFKKANRNLKASPTLQLVKLQEFHYNLINDDSHIKDVSKNKLNINERLKQEYNDLVLNSHTNEYSILRNKIKFKIKGFFIRLILPFLQCYLKIGIIEPEHMFKLIWDIIILTVMLINITIIPIKICFELDFSDKKRHIIFEIFPIVLFTLDMFFNLNCAYYSKGAYITDKMQILKQYLKYHFIFDLSTILPLYLSFFLNKKWIEMFFLFQLFKMNKLVKKMEEHLELAETAEGVFQLLKLLFVIVFMAHLCGCTWHWIALFNIKNGDLNTWLHVNKLMDTSWYERYVNSLYFSVLTMITVGYVVTDSFLERTISIILVLILAGMFAYSINSVGQILQDMAKNTNELK